MLRHLREHRRAIAQHAKQAHAARAHIGNQRIHQRQTGRRQHTGADGERSERFFIAHTARADRVDHNNGKHQRSERIHGVVAFQKAFHQRLRDKFALCGLKITHRPKHRSAHQHRNTQQQKRRQHLADAVDQLARRHRQPIRHRKKNDAENSQRPSALRFGRFAQKRHHADFKRHRGRARNGKQRAYRQIKQHRKQQPVKRRHARSKLLHIARTRITDGSHTQKRQAGTCEHKAQHGRHNMFTRLLPHSGRKNQIACAEKQRKQHQAGRPKQ